MQKKLLGLAIGSALMAAEGATASTGGSADAKVKFCEKEYDPDTKVCYFAFGNGVKLELDVNSLSPEMQTQLMLHGAIQKIGDSYAGAKGNYVEGVQSAKDVIAQLQAGEWRAGRDDSARPRLEELAGAIARIKGVDVAKAKAAVESATDDQRKEWRSNAKVKAEIAKMRAEKAAAALEQAGEQALNIDLK